MFFFFMAWYVVLHFSATVVIVLLSFALIMCVFLAVNTSGGGGAWLCGLTGGQVGVRTARTKSEYSRWWVQCRWYSVCGREAVTLRRERECVWTYLTAHRHPEQHTEQRTHTQLSFTCPAGIVYLSEAADRWPVTMFKKKSKSTAITQPKTT